MTRADAVRLVGAMAAAALIPAIFGATLLVSVTVHRPLLIRVRRPSVRANANALTVAWGVGLLAIAAGQFAGAIIGLGSITSPTGIVERAGFALIAEALLLAATAIYLARESHVHSGDPRVGVQGWDSERPAAPAPPRNSVTGRRRR